MMNPLFFVNRNDVLKKISNIDDGVGAPEWRLTLCLLFSWIVVALILMKGVASSGKVCDLFSTIIKHT